MDLFNYSGCRSGPGCAIVNYSDEQSDRPRGLVNYSDALNQVQEK